MDTLKRYWWIGAILLALVVMGGGGSPDATDENAPLNARAAWCWSLAVASASPATPDRPQPKPGDPCDNCQGRGKVGDGVTMVTCKVCGGTGKHPANDTGDEIAWEEFDWDEDPEEDEPQPEETAVVQYGSCADGSCGASRGGQRVGFFRRVFGRR